MNRFIFLATIALFSFADAQSVRAFSRHSLQRIFIQEPFVDAGYTFSGLPGRILNYANRNATQFTLVDSSYNGYGMWGANLRPLFVSTDGWLIAYRQWADISGGSGQIGTAYSTNALDWTTYSNLNTGFGAGRYPSALGTPDYPYTFWSEYVSMYFQYAPYYSFDSAEWGGDAWVTPLLGNPMWEEDYLWMFTPDVSFSTIENQYMFNYAASDYTNSKVWIFHSEEMEDGTIIFGAGQLVIDNWIWEPDGGSYISRPVMDINEFGIGYAAVTMYVQDVLNPPYDSSHSLNFVKTEDYGASWSEAIEPYVYYTLPSTVFDHMVSTGEFDLNWEWECLSGGLIEAADIFATYDFDLRVDSDGDPHFLIGLVAADPDGVWEGHSSNAIYHFTIDHNYLENPGTPNSPTGWNYSKVMGMSEMFRWNNANGSSYWQIVFPSLAISEENDNVMYAVISGPVEGDFITLDDGGTPDDTCDDLGGYPHWNEEIFVVKSEDGGQSWWCPVNVTQTIPDCYYDENEDLICTDDWMCPDSEIRNTPDETMAHAGTGATDDRVNIIFQTPDWCFGSTTGDPASYDHKNRIYVGWVELNEEDDSYCTDPNSIPGDVNSDGSVDVMDIVGMVNFIVFANPLPCEPCGDLNNDDTINVQDIILVVNLIIGD